MQIRASGLLLALLLGFVLPSVARGQDWQIERIDTASGELGFSVRVGVDAAQGVHVASSQVDMNGWYRSHPAGGVWQTPGLIPGRFEDFGLDRQDRPAMLLRDYLTPVLAIQDTNGQWQTETLSDIRGSGMCLRFDSQNEPHIAYEDTSAHAIKYAYRHDGAWNITTVATDSSLWTSVDVALALDNNDNPHIAWTDPGTSDHTLEHAYWTGTEFAYNTLGHGWAESLSFDADNTLHTSYTTYDSRELWHATFDGSEWSQEFIVDDAGSPGVVAFDSDGRSHIVYGRNYAAGSDQWDKVYHLVQTESGWERDLIDEWWSPSSVGSEAMWFTIDATNQMHTVYSDDARVLWYATAPAPEPTSLVCLLMLAGCLAGRRDGW